MYKGKQKAGSLFAQECKYVMKKNLLRFNTNDQISEKLDRKYCVWCTNHNAPTYPFKAAWDKYADGAIRHLSLRLSASNTPILPSKKVA